MKYKHYAYDLETHGPQRTDTEKRKRMSAIKKKQAAKKARRKNR